MPTTTQAQTAIFSSTARAAFVATTHHPESDVGTAEEYANAAFIVTACNSYERTLAENKALREALEALMHPEFGFMPDKVTPEWCAQARSALEGS